ncbi:MAG: tetratricopeptide repeat protein [Pirellulales bacterium]|nr:tetratricopeptide repeat protein [Pirellulales bacterium]
MTPYRLLIFLLALMLAAMAWLAADWWTCLPAGKAAQYVGRQECARCHEEETALWTGSDHDRAMASATAETVRGNFDHQQFTHEKAGPNPFRGVTSELFRRGDEFFATTDGPDGRLQTFPVKYTFGFQPLQQYLVEFPDGRVQCLPITWDTEQKRWFHLYPDEDIPFDDALHWTRPLQNWNYMCAECHSTNLQKNYDLKTNTYRTTWSEIDVSCEACHGPGSLHVELADSFGLFWDRRIGYGLPPLKAEDSRVEIESCAPCHARRRVVYPGFKSGDKLLDYYLPELLDGELYYADGQILEEDYVYGSYIQSKMYAMGVRCTDCHDPHSARVKHTAPDAPWGVMPDNRLCTDCHMGTHPAGTYDGVAHHHHPDASQPGTKCVECHMPETPYMVVDPRRDHSMRIPRPDLTIWLGIPNACNRCHHDESKGETPEWAEQQVQQWYGKRKEPTHFAYAIAGGREGKPEAEQALEAVTRRKDVSATVRASALLLLSRYPTPTGNLAAVRGLKDPDALVRSASVRCLQLLPDDLLRRRLAPTLHDPVRAVRTEAARILSVVPRGKFSPEDGKAFDAALTEYLDGQKSLDDQPAAHLNVAVVFANLGDLDKAKEECRTALRLDPRFIPARVNLAMFFGLQAQQAAEENRHAEAEQKKAEAEEQFRRVIELEPELAEAHYSLGLLLGENEDRLADAAESLATAARLAPQNARIHYNYGLALQRLERLAEAEASLKTACKLGPGVPDYLHALTVLYAQQRHWANATACAEQMARQWPGDPQVRALLQYLRRQSQQQP